METIIHRVLNVYRSEGLGSLLRQGTRVVFGRLDPLYQRIKPAYIERRVAVASAEFDTGPRALDEHDFVDDIASERDVLERFISDLRGDDIVFDVGANVGIYTCFAGDRLTDGEIISFEPSPTACAVLRSNIKQNQIDGTVHQIALSNENGTTMLQLQGRTGHHIATDQAGNSLIEIETRRGDDLVNNNEVPSPTVCKFDIEGAEYLALDGLRETLSNSTCRLVYCEVHTEKMKPIGGSPEAVEDLLESCGFEVEYLEERRENYFLRATK